MLTAFKKIVSAILIFEARLVLAKYHPKVIAVTGSVGKTGTKEAVYQALKNIYSIRESEKSYNSEIGLPLTVLGAKNAWHDPLGWLEVFLHGLGLIFRKREYPKWLVVEVGVDRPGDMHAVTKWLKTDIVIITALPETPVHVEFFPSSESLIREKSLILETLRHGGTAILNGDDERIRQVREWKKANLMAKNVRVLTYGFETGNDLQVEAIGPLYEGEEGNQRPAGLNIRIDYRGNSLPVKLPGILGRHQVYAALAALSVGLARDLNLIEIISSLEHYTAPPGRLRLIAGKENTTILDDTYNSSPAALTAALETLSSFETGGRKIAVLGDMLELGEHTVAAHRAAGKQAATFLDLLITVGPRAKFISDEATKRKMGKRKLRHFDTIASVITELPPLLKSGDLILVKGSQGVRMEKIVAALMANPDQQNTLLCRQDPEWQKR